MGILNRTKPVGRIDNNWLKTYILNISEEEEEGSFQPPTQILSDYLEITSLSLILPLGAIFNLCILRKLFKSYRHRTTILHQHDVKAAFLLLKVHLTIANLLVLLLHCSIKIGWLATYRWVAGAVICKMSQFVVSFSLHISSNIVTCIAFDRMRIVGRLCSKSTHVNPIRTNSIHQVSQLLLGAWITAVLFSSPQLVVWTTYYLLPDWAQCTTVWMIGRFIEDEYFLVSYKTYQTFHLIMVFWLPFVLILMCYSIIIYKLASFACSPFEQTSSELLPMVEIESVNTTSLPDLQSARISSHNHSGSNQEVDTEDLNESTVNKGDSLSPNPQRSRSNTCADVSLTVKVNRRTSQSRRRSAVETSSLLPQRPVAHIRTTPTWRIQMRSKMFKTTAAVVICYMVCWFPYNVLGWLMLYDVDLTNRLGDQLNWLKNMILINSVLNPILYGFSDD